MSFFCQHFNDLDIAFALLFFCSLEQPYVHQGMLDKIEPETILEAIKSDEPPVYITLEMFESQICNNDEGGVATIQVSARIPKVQKFPWFPFLIEYQNLAGSNRF